MAIMMMMVVDGREVVDGIIKGRNAEPYLTNHTTPYSIPHQPYHIIPHTAPTIPHLIAHSLTAAHYCSFGGDLNFNKETLKKYLCTVCQIMRPQRYRWILSKAEGEQKTATVTSIRGRQREWMRHKEVKRGREKEVVNITSSSGMLRGRQACSSCCYFAISTLKQWMNRETVTHLFMDLQWIVSF